MHDITNFRIGTAHYILENKKGSKVRLSLNYGQNTFAYKILVESGDLEKLKKQAQVVAKHLLGRKAKRNLSYKLLKLTMKV